MSTAFFAAAIAAILWGANFNLSQTVIAEMHPLTAGAGRFAAAALLMVLFVFVRGDRIPLRRNARSYAILGSVGIGGFNLLFFMGMQSTSAINGALIMAINPLVTALLAAAFLGERLGVRQILALPVAALGVAVVILGDGKALRIAEGDALMIGANLAWAVYNVLCRPLMPKDASPLANASGIMIMGAAVMGAAALIVQAPSATPSAPALGALLVMAVGGSAVAYILWNQALAQMGAARTALFLNLVPVSTMVIAAIGGAPPAPAQILGGLLVGGAILAAAWPRRRTITA